MRKTIFILLIAFMGVGMVWAQDHISFEGRKTKPGLAVQSAASRMDYAAKLQPLTEHPALAESFLKHKRSKKVGKADNITPEQEATLATAEWGTAYSVEDGKQHIYTVEYIPSTYRKWFISGAKFTFYDDALQAGKSFTVPMGVAGHSISLMKDVSTTVFNSDAKTEYMVWTHEFDTTFADGGPISCRDTLHIINEDGVVLKKIGKSFGATIHGVDVGSWQPEYRLQMTEASYVDLSDTARSYVYKAKDFLKENAQPLHTFHTSSQLTSYSDGPIARFMQIEGEPYYVTTKYKKPFIVEEESSEDEIVVEKDNLFEVYIHDAKFNLIKKVELPLIGMDENDMSMSAIMYFDPFMITRHTFNNDDKFEFLYAMNRYVVSCDCNVFDFYLMDEEGNQIKELVKGVAGVHALQDIAGMSKQYALSLGDEDAVTGITMLDMPSLEEVIHFPALHNNELLSMNFERVPDADRGYQYIFGLGRAEATQTTIYGGIVYFDREGRLTKRVRIELGNDVVSFQPIFNSSTLNPYTFLPDEAPEYLCFVRYQITDTKVARGLLLADQNGNTLYSWRAHPQYGELTTAGILADEYSTRLKNLYVSYTDEAQGSTHHVFYRLPLQAVQLQGDGTKTSPYLIHNAVELDQIRRYPQAYFALANDLDMTSFGGVEQRGFTSIPTFKGQLDGRNHSIRNLKINGNGLFTALEGATLKNITFKNVYFNAIDNYCGAIAGTSSASLIQNCHVQNHFVTDRTADKVGGLVGQATLDNRIDRCSYEGSIEGKNLNELGGIAGRMTGGSTITNSYVKGDILGKSTVGGIAGMLLSGAAVHNSYSTANVTASHHQAGGIVGETGAHNGYVTRAYAGGEVKTDTLSKDKWFTGMAGGIAGALTAGAVKYCFALNPKVTSPELPEAPESSPDKVAYSRVAWPEYYVDADGNRSMDSNYALQTMLIGTPKNAAALTDDATCAADKRNGESGSLEKFNQAFYEKNRWSFGTDSAHAWKMSGNTPRLWWEFVVRGIELVQKEAKLKQGDTLVLQARVIPQDADNQKVRWSSSDPSVASVNAKGVVKGIATGEAVITARSEEGGYTATCKVSVVVPVERVTFDAKEIHIPAETRVLVHASVYPENATNQHLVYVSLDQNILITSGALIYAIATEGTARLVAMSEDGPSDTCLVTVIEPVQEIYLNETNIELDKQKPTFQLVAEVFPAAAEGAPLAWSSADNTTASVNNTGLVSGHHKGTTKVTVATLDGSVKTICAVTVKEFIDDYVANQDLEKQDLRAYRKGNDIQVESGIAMASVRLLNLSGQCVYERGGLNATQTLVPCDRLASGIYLLEVRLSNGAVKVIKAIK